MPQAMRVEDAVHGLMQVTARTFVLLTWSLVLLLHVTALCLALAAAWYWQVRPETVRSVLASAVPAPLASTAGGILGFLGLSGLALAAAYAEAWQWLVRQLASRFVLDFD